jgi:hypothetical protein
MTTAEFLEALGKPFFRIQNVGAERRHAVMVSG